MALDHMHARLAPYPSKISGHERHQSGPHPDQTNSHPPRRWEQKRCSEMDCADSGDSGRHGSEVRESLVFHAGAADHVLQHLRTGYNAA